MSPIKGLTDRGMSFPEIGRIRKGEMRTFTREDGSKYQRPVDLDYFRVVFAEGEEEAEKIFRDHYDPEPKEINIMLPLSLGAVWDAWLEAYTSGRLIARSDGEYMQYWYDPQKGEKIVVDWRDKNGKQVPYTGKPGDEMVVGKTKTGNNIVMKPIGRLKVVIRELERFAYLTFITGSYYDIDNISSQLKSYYQIASEISGVPLILKRRPKEISTPVGNGNRQRLEKWLVEIEPRYDWVKQKMLEAQAKENIFRLTPGIDLPETEEGIEPSELAEVAYDDVVEGEVEEIEEDTKPEPGQKETQEYPEAVYDIMSHFKLIGMAGIRQLTDKQILEVKGVGPATKDQIRELFPEIVSENDSTQKGDPDPEPIPGPKSEKDYNFLYHWAKARDDVSHNDINKLLQENDMDALKAWAFLSGGK